MFQKRADCAILGVKDKPMNLFEELASVHATDYAKIAALEETDARHQNYNLYKRIAEKKPNILAFATRAISAYESWGANKNGDAFERNQLEQYHKSFVMQPHLMDHKMEIPYIRGLIAAAHWRPIKTAGEGDFVETLIFVNRDDFPKYASHVENGTINSFSMGVEVQEAECSHCHNIARNPRELCIHADKMKNLFVQGKKVFEFNRGLNFIEQSSVVSPADIDSHTLYVLAHTKTSQHADVERLRKVAAILNSYTEDEKNVRFGEYQMFEAYANTVADRIAQDLNIDWRKVERSSF